MSRATIDTGAGGARADNAKCASPKIIVAPCTADPGTPEVPVRFPKQRGRIPAHREPWYPPAKRNCLLGSAEPLIYTLHPKGAADAVDIADAGHATGAVDAAATDDATDVVRKLRAKLEDYSRSRARRAGWSRRFISTGLTPLDTVLPHNGLPCGAVIEIFSHDLGVGSMALAMRIAGRCILCGRHRDVVGMSYSDPNPKRRGAEVGRVLPAAALTAPTLQGGMQGGLVDHRCIVLIDTMKDFYPPAAWQQGIAFDRLIVLRATGEKDAFWAMEQSLRCSAVAAVIAPLTHLEERLSRRLQLAAESSGCMGLILRPMRRRTRGFAAVQMLVESVGREEPSRSACASWSHGGWRGAVRTHSSFGRAQTDGCCLGCITLLKVREGMPAGPLWVDLHHETGAWPLHPIPVDRSAAKFA